jgi:hypothetical protein
VWVHAIYIYANVAKEIAPKRQRLKEATESLGVKQVGVMFHNNRRLNGIYVVSLCLLL